MAAKKTLIERLTTGYEVQAARDYVGIQRVAMLISRKDGGIRLVLPARVEGDLPEGALARDEVRQGQLRRPAKKAAVATK
jgi:hypothetical protein